MKTTRKTGERMKREKTTKKGPTNPRPSKKEKIPKAKIGRKAGKARTDFNATFLETLSRKKEELIETLGLLKRSRMDYDGRLNAGEFIDEIDDAEREISSHKLYSLLERKNKELRNIERLINRIQHEEEFGICEECGKKIPRERLLIVPETVLCVACQRELERWDHRVNASTGAASAFGRTKDLDWGDSNDSYYEDESILSELSIEDEALPPESGKPDSKGDTEGKNGG